MNSNRGRKTRILGSFGMLAITMLLLAPSATAQLPVHETLTPVENASCGPLDPIYAYACRMVFWGVYGSEHQVVCAVVGEFVPLEYIFGRRVVCEPPEGPRPDVSGVDVLQ